MNRMSEKTIKKTYADYNRYVAKPIDVDELLNKINTYLESK